MSLHRPAKAKKGLLGDKQYGTGPCDGRWYGWRDDSDNYTRQCQRSRHLSRIDRLFLGNGCRRKIDGLGICFCLVSLFYNKFYLARVHTWDAVQGKCVQQLLCCLLVPWVSNANIESLARWQRSFDGCARGAVRINEAIASEKWPTQIQINSRQKN